MAACLEFFKTTIDAQGRTRQIYFDSSTELSQCGLANTAEEVALTGLEYADLSEISSMAELYQTYFAFDEALFLQLQGWMLLTFVVGFGVGKVVNILNLSNRT